MNNPIYSTTDSTDHKKLKRFPIPIIICSLLIVCLFPVKAITQDADFIFNEMRAIQEMNWEGIQNYTVTLSVRDAGGLETSVYYQRMDVDGQVTFREIPRPIYEREMSIKAGFPPPEDMAAGMAGALTMAAPYMSYPGLNMGQMIAFANAGAVAYDSISNGTAEAKDAVADMKLFAQRAQLVGTEQVVATSGENQSTREAYHIVADDLFDVAMDQSKDGGEFTLERIDLWVDTEQMVPLLLKMQGQMERDNTITPITISKIDLDYKKVGTLNESFTKIYRLSGIMQAMSKKEQKQMEEAKAQMEQMTEEQKAMMNKMMPGKMKQMEDMLNGGAIESIVDVASVAVNEGPPTSYGMGSLGMVPALTTIGESVNEDGVKVAELVISTGPGHPMEMVVGLIGNAPFPSETGSVLIVNASGHVADKSAPNGRENNIVGASGNIVISHRSETQMKGTYNASLQYEGGNYQISGNFDSGINRGSPVPAMFNLDN